MLLTSISVFSILLERSALVIPIPISIEYRLPWLEFEEVIEKKICSERPLSRLYIKLGSDNIIEVRKFYKMVISDESSYNQMISL